MNVPNLLVAQLQREVETTRKLLERVPQASPTWKPHKRSRTLGGVAAHIAHLPGIFIAHLGLDEFNLYDNDYRAETDTTKAILATFDKNITKSLERLKTLFQKQLLAPWRYRYGEQVVFEMPRLSVVQFMAMNHIVHHRGQLSVYLRLEVPLPSIYGPTANEPLTSSSGEAKKELEL